MNLKLIVQVLVSAAIIYGALWPLEAYDLPHAYYVWLNHIREAGSIAAFSVPFGDYTPPYLYLLTAISALGLSPLNTIKLISTGAAIVLALGVRQLIKSVNGKGADEAALISLLLPSVIINGPMLGQCDGYWVGFCLLAVAAACRGQVLVMALWAGAAFAFKAQSIFIAPFCLAVVIQHRRWTALTVPPAVYLTAMLPAWLAGWPMSDLLTVYVRQHGLFEWLSTAPNFWALPALFNQYPPAWLSFGAYIAVGTCVIIYLWRFPKPLIAAALLSAMMLPWFLPKMHERYFLLADILAFCIAWTFRRAGPIFACVQLGSLLSIAAWLAGLPTLNVIASLFTGTGLVLLMLHLRSPEAEVKRVAANERESKPAT